jgi:hypothetical protein
MSGDLFEEAVRIDRSRGSKGHFVSFTADGIEVDGSIMRLPKGPQCNHLSTPSPPMPFYPTISRNRSTTYTGELDAAVAALGSSAALLDVKNAEVATGGLNDPRPVRGRVVPIEIHSQSPRFLLKVARWFRDDGQPKSKRATHGFRRR